MKSYKKIIIQAWDIKPGDILYSRVKTNRWPEVMTVKSITLMPQQVKIITTHGFVYNFAGEHTFLKELSPAEEGEMAVQQNNDPSIQEDIDRLNADIIEAACDILDILETHIKDLTDVRDGKSMQAGSFAEIGDDFRKALNKAENLQEYSMDQEALTDELKSLNQAADEGPYGRNK